MSLPRRMCKSLRHVHAIDAFDWISSKLLATLWAVRDYFIRRFLLFIPTLLVITMIVFGVSRIAPGGPLEQAMMEAQMVSMEGGGGRAEGAALSEEQLEQMKELYGYDKPVHVAYLVWLGVMPRELNRRDVDFIDGRTNLVVRMRVPTFHVSDLDWNEDGFVQLSEVPKSVASYVKFEQLDTNGDGLLDGWEAEAEAATIERAREPVEVELVDGQPRIANAGENMVDWKVRQVESAEEMKDVPRAELYRTRYAGVFQGDLGKSFRHGEPVMDVMAQRLPVSTFYGVLTFIFTFLVCVPLGIAKAMKHNTWFDNGSSVFIFMGYAVPGYVLGALMMVFLAARLEWFPTGGFVGPHYESTLIENVSVTADSSEWLGKNHGLRDGQHVWLEGDLPRAEPALEKEAAYVVARKSQDAFELLPEAGTPPILIKANAGKVELRRHTTAMERAWDLAWHAVLPLLCYLVGSFAFVTMLMKNHLMDNLSADYMRTAIAKGVPFSQAVRRHALRNSLIPLATNIGHQITLFVAGSFLIETIFDINGFGLLGFKSVLDRDIPVVMGIFLLSATLMLLGNIISDILVALVDPRVRFD